MIPVKVFKKWPIVSQVDIAPTILQALNIAIPSSWQGVALQKTPKSRSIFASQGNEVEVYTDLTM
jgi:arylsulfatase A-like enzyme